MVENEIPDEGKPTAIETEEKLTAKLRRRRSGNPVQDDVPWAAVARGKPERLAKALEHARLCARIADDNRAKDVLLLDLRQATPLVDFFVIATADSRRQSNAIAGEVDQEMKRLGERKLGMEGSEEGRWVLIDYGDFVVHVFSSEARTYYSLEDIWGDAVRIDWRNLEADDDPPAAGTGPAAEPAPSGDATPTS
jgi:ribosome-associated protein